ncbi:unnamed protein product [Bemisia tabaci]|uniref:Potassium channel domain-containing protein n=1 Tax=Bemisia tabaci TaxID=7038 RepID=A0A9P0F456_BEMTA|nr:unnamed protein product [Bemisia tabaci]
MGSASDEPPSFFQHASPHRTLLPPSPLLRPMNHLLNDKSSGWGGTVPLTTAGRVLVILYGFLACSGGILFFNLFLERVITLLAYILRLLYIRDLRKRKGTEIHDMDIHQDLEEWKPSVYWVLVCLATMSAVVGSFGGWLYSTHENWSYFEAVYYCFVSFSTIGLGDYVSGEGHANEPLYSVLSFIVISLGSCCTYSLFNVLSIIIKQFLNWLIWHLDCHCFDRETDKGDRMLRRHSIRFQREQRERRRRSSLTVPKTIRRTRKGGAGGAPSSISNNNEEGDDVDSDSGGGEPGRRLSGEMISMKGLVCGNKVNLAVMQKQLYETAQMSRGGGGYDRSTHFGPGTVGPLAIVSHKFGEK